MGKREDLERALGPFYKGNYISNWVDTKALAEQAIVEDDVEILHHKGPTSRGSWLRIPRWGKEIWLTTDFVGIPGKALAIILPLEEVNGNTNKSSTY